MNSPEVNPYPFLSRITCFTFSSGGVLKERIKSMMPLPEQTEGVWRNEQWVWVVKERFGWGNFFRSNSAGGKN